MLQKFIFISILSPFIFTTHSYNNKFLHHQKSLLLQLKNELIFNSSISTKLVHWPQSDEWYGVECDASGNVVSLQLDHEAISGGIGDSSSLFKLIHLQKLNLAYNKFNLSPIPKRIHNLTYLTHLNLSFAGFGGQVPKELSFLRRLVSLDISNDDKTLKLENPNLEMVVRNLTGLRELYLDGLNVTSSHERKKWSHIISSHLPDLTGLSLRDCGLSGHLVKSFSQLHSLSILRLDGNDLSTVVLDSFANFSSLTTLTLAYSNLKGSFPSMIFHIPTLEILDLSFNALLSGSIPPFTRNGSLNTIVLRFTNFLGSIPSSISNLKTLSYIDLVKCRFSGSIPSTFTNLTELRHVDLSYNFLSGSLSSTLFHSLSKLVALDLSCNQLEGPIPDSLFHLQSLEFLLLSENLFNGTFQLDKIQNLVNLTELDLSGNKNVLVEVGNSNPSSCALTLLEVLRLSSCNMNEFPGFIKHCDLVELDLSNNWIDGQIPGWIWGRRLQRLDLSSNRLTSLQKPYHIPTSLQFMYLHSNELGGELHLPIPSNVGNRTSELSVLSLASNSFSGSIPISLCNAMYLRILDLSVNKLSGGIPSCLLENTMILRVISLGKNNISGHIPDRFSSHCSLEYLDLNGNVLEGKIPKSLKSCKSLVVLNVGNNKINDVFPCMLSSSLRVLVLHFNRFHGEVRCHNSWPCLQVIDISSNHFNGSLESINFTSWGAMLLDNDTHLQGYYYLQGFGATSGVKLMLKGVEEQFVKIWYEFNVIDFSCNSFHGGIPNAIGDLNSLHVLNFSHNALNGGIPKLFGKMSKLESLDLSMNLLSGSIPREFAELTFLSFLNLSYNKLNGEIPNGRQLQTFSVDSFKGNSGLCGFPLNVTCTGTSTNDSDQSPSEDEEIEWEYVFAALGYVVALGSIGWLLLFCRSFREKYFDIIDEFVEDILNYGCKRRRTRRASMSRVYTQ
ncbi:receptor-like protein 7 [Salvia hispanica]|uniref:receptor-like protein 7 n=1 Tax=Salvia hispanica TaxID=49212 RepID=UPI0020092533|nr:receptor-like protein 7 [Salvia hispanica]